jgi:uncharacterized protein YheU (UPF0270 family)
MYHYEEEIVIPHCKLSAEALLALIEEFVTRDGTDSGYTRGSLTENVAMVGRQLDAGEAVIVYDARTRTSNIVPADTVSRHGPHRFGLTQPEEEDS